MSVVAVINFDISNSFSEWETSFYATQPKARENGIYELFHGYDPENPQKLVVMLRAPSEEAMNKFMQDNGEAVAKSGHVLESTKITIYKD